MLASCLPHGHRNTPFPHPDPPTPTRAVFTNYPEWASFNSFLKSEHAPGGLEVGEQLEMHFHPPGQKPQTFKPLVGGCEVCVCVGGGSALGSRQHAHGVGGWVGGADWMGMWVISTGV